MDLVYFGADPGTEDGQDQSPTSLLRYSSQFVSHPSDHLEIPNKYYSVCAVDNALFKQMYRYVLKVLNKIL
jgi:hypothetical protein